MTLTVSRVDLLGGGATGDVFRVPGTDRVCKVYRRRPTNPDWERWALRIRDEEVEAYRLAASDPILARHTPQCSSTTIRAVLDENAAEVTREYLPEAALVLEYVAGSPVPIHYAAEVDPYFEDLIERLREVGVSIDEVEICNHEDPANCRLIDLTTPWGWAKLSSISR
jgi:hypothetical protein